MNDFSFLFDYLCRFSPRPFPIIYYRFRQFAFFSFNYLCFACACIFDLYHPMKNPLCTRSVFPHPLCDHDDSTSTGQSLGERHDGNEVCWPHLFDRVWFSCVCCGNGHNTYTFCYVDLTLIISWDLLLFSDDELQQQEQDMQMLSFLNTSGETFELKFGSRQARRGRLTRRTNIKRTQGKGKGKN